MYKNWKNKLEQERYVSLSPLNKTFTLSAVRKVRSHQKIMLALIRMANNLLGKEKSMDCWPFNFIFKYVPFFKYCTEQNTKKNISLKRCYFVIKP